jgi:CRP/FNR family transcriptional regulator, cyclic AMP receptor protein
MASRAKQNIISTLFPKTNGSGRQTRVYRDKEVVYFQDGRADAVFYVQSGIVKITMDFKGRQRKAMLALLQEGDVFGEGCLGTGTRRTSTATSIGQSSVTRLEKANFRSKLDEDKVFTGHFIRYLISRTERFHADLADLFLNSSEKRLARILLMYGCLEQEPKGGLSAPGFDQATLAEMVGTTRARVSTFMNEFRRKGYVRYNRGEIEVDARRLTSFLQV